MFTSLWGLFDCCLLILNIYKTKNKKVLNKSRKASKITFLQKYFMVKNIFSLYINIPSCDNIIQWIKISPLAIPLLFLWLVHIIGIERNAIFFLLLFIFNVASIHELISVHRFIMGIYFKILCEYNEKQIKCLMIEFFIHKEL